MNNIAFNRPSITKASLVKGKTISFRNAVVDDAEFILSLRTNKSLSKFLSPTGNSIDDQKKWLEKYEKDTGQAYFIIVHNEKKIGTVRLYDAKGISFCWGSWILEKTRPRQAAVESALMVYAYAVDHLGFEKAHFDVRKGNEKVWKFHEKFGAIRTSETEEDYYYELDLENINKSRLRLIDFLPNGVVVV